MMIGIVGLGLIGGSLARAVSTRTRHFVLGIDASEKTAADALASGAVSGELTDERLKECDFVFVALYCSAAIEYVRSRAALFKKGAVVLDCCGVKRAVCAPLEKAAEENGFWFVGAHPMAGAEKSGFSASREALFSGASMILTPSGAVEAGVIRKIEDLCLKIGFRGVRLSTPDEHDRIIAFTSQLAHVISCAYISSPAAGEAADFSAGSFLDMTRVARLNETMWTELFLENADNLANEVDRLGEALKRYSQILRSGDRDALFALLRSAREKKEFVDGKAQNSKAGKR